MYLKVLGVLRVFGVFKGLVGVNGVQGLQDIGSIKGSSVSKKTEVVDQNTHWQSPGRTWSVYQIWWSSAHRSSQKTRTDRQTEQRTSFIY